MFLAILLTAIVLLLCFEFIGKGLKKIFKIKFLGMNLLIGYAFSLLVFYFTSLVFISKYVIPVNIVLLLPFIYQGLKTKKDAYDFFIISIITLFIIHFFTLTFIVPEAAKSYLISINRELNLSPYQNYTLALAKFLRFHSLLFTVNIMTIINLFTILYTFYECLKYLFGNLKTRRLAFLFFLLLFIILNSPNQKLLISQNAYYFLYHPYQGKTLYLYALIPFQFILFSRLNKNNIFLLILINLSSFIFTPISIILQMFLNIAYMIVLFFNKNKAFIPFFFSVTFLPLLFNLLLVNFSLNLILFLIIILGATILVIRDKHSFLSIIILTSLISYLIFTYHQREFNYGLLNLEYNKKEKSIFFIYYALVIYSLIIVSKDKHALKKVFFDLQLIIFSLIINPVTFYFVLTYQFTYLYLLFLLPSTLTIIYVFFKHAKIIEKTMIILLILSISQTIYYPLKPINQTKQNVYYRINREAVEISHYLNQKQEIKNILVSQNLQTEMAINTKADILTNENDNIYLLNLMINDLIPFDLFHFLETIEENNINGIIVDKDKKVNDYLAIISTSDKEFDYYIIYFY